MVKLGDVALVTMGQAPPGSSYNSEGLGKPLIAGAGDFRNGRAHPTKYTSEPKKIANVKDIILSIRASIGDKVWADQELCLGRGVAGIKPGREMDVNFLWHLLERLRSNLLAKGKGATFLQVNRNDIESLTFPLPPLDEQRRIAAALDSSRSVIHASEMLLGSSNFLKVRALERLLSKRDDLKEMSMESLIHNISSGSSPKCENREARAGEVGVLKLSAVTGGQFRANENKAFLGDPKFLKGEVIQNDDVLMTRKNTLDLVGNVALARPSTASLYLPDTIFKISLNKSQINTDYFHVYSQLPEFRQKIRSIAGGSAVSMSNISQGRLYKVKIKVPPLNVQQEFSSYCHSVDPLISINRERLGLLQELHQSLQSRAFRGEL